MSTGAVKNSPADALSLRTANTNTAPNRTSVMATHVFVLVSRCLINNLTQVSGARGIALTTLYKIRAIGAFPIKKSKRKYAPPLRDPEAACS